MLDSNNAVAAARQQSTKQYTDENGVNQNQECLVTIGSEVDPSSNGSSVGSNLGQGYFTSTDPIGQLLTTYRTNPLYAYQGQKTVSSSTASSLYVAPDWISANYDDAVNTAFDPNSNAGWGDRALGAAVAIVGAPAALLDKTANWIENIPYSTGVVYQDFATAAQDTNEGDGVLYSLKGIHDIATLSFGILGLAAPFAEGGSPSQTVAPEVAAPDTTPPDIAPLDIAPLDIEDLNAVDVPNAGVSNPVAAGASLTGADTNLATAASWVKPQDGVFDVVVHGDANGFSVQMADGSWQDVSANQLSNYMNANGYAGEPVRLISCGTGACDATAAQNLANQVGNPVIAPSDTVWIHPNGNLTIGPSHVSNTGTWNTFVPGGNKP